MGPLSDLEFFSIVAKHASLRQAALQLGITPPAVSKRLVALERRLGVRLLHRTTRHASLTPEGETYLSDGARVLEDLQTLENKVAGGREVPRGVLRVVSSLGFGRRVVSPALSAFSRRYPDVEVRLTLTDRPINQIERGFDLHIRLGELPDSTLTARLLAHHRRILSASSAYLDRHGHPATPRELAQHACLDMQKDGDTFGTWHLRSNGHVESVKIRGPLASNDGECLVNWALDGHGILMRSLWEISPYLRSGRLIHVLPKWELPPADVYAVFPSRDYLSAKTRALVDFLLDAFEPHRRDLSGQW